MIWQVIIENKVDLYNVFTGHPVVVGINILVRNLRDLLLLSAVCRLTCAIAVDKFIADNCDMFSYTAV